MLAREWHPMGRERMAQHSRESCMADRRGEIADIIRERILSGLHVGALRPGSRLPSDLIVSTSLDAQPSQHVARCFGKPAVTVAMRQDLIAEWTRHLNAGPLYMIGSDPRFRSAAHAIFDPMGFGAQILTLVVRANIAATSALDA